MKSLAEASAAVAAAVAAVDGDGANTRAAILALAGKQNSSNAAIHESLSAVRESLVAIATAMTANGQDIDGQIAATAAAVEVPDFDSAAEEAQVGS